MRFYIQCKPRNRTARIPIQYNQYVQAYLYTIFEKTLPELHSEGYQVGNRRFRHFVFSRLFSKNVHRDGDYLLFSESIQFYASFLVEPMPKIVIEHLITDQNLRLANEEFQVTDARVFADPFNFDDQPEKFPIESEIQTLSPVVTYRTENREGRKYTHYFKPYDPEFPEEIKNNLLRKYESIFHQPYAEPDQFHLVPTRFEQPRDESVLKFKGTVIKGYSGHFHLRCSPTLFKIAYHTGLGSKNAQGFGMFKILEPR
ncbi:MAG TPA: CRISPR-associated endoribonuclease Cas6 [Thermotogota bacterium]|nr:CRISPR-associated endoribonuclease Cas6 [Thermotogota bacterium]